MPCSWERGIIPARNRSRQYHYRLVGRYEKRKATTPNSLHHLLAVAGGAAFRLAGVAGYLFAVTISGVTADHNRSLAQSVGRQSVQEKPDYRQAVRKNNDTHRGGTVSFYPQSDVSGNVLDFVRTGCDYRILNRFCHSSCFFRSDGRPVHQARVENARRSIRPGVPGLHEAC